MPAILYTLPLPAQKQWMGIIMASGCAPTLSDADVHTAVHHNYALAHTSKSPAPIKISMATFQRASLDFMNA